MRESNVCGLVGVYGSGGGTVARELLYAMGGELVHRGPDGTGAYFDGAFGMLSTRLSIVDIEGGDQPLPNETARYWVMQNGEIFNHPELRTELESRGHRFATHCDTEVLVHAFEEWGAHCLDHLNGEFAFAIWDRETETLFLARDRFGIRPLFLLEVGRTLELRLEHEQHRHRAPTVGIAQHRGNAAHDLAQRVGRRQLRVRRPDLGRAGGEDLDEELVARFPVPVDRRLGDSRPGDDRVDSDGPGAAFDEQVRRAADDPLAGAGDAGVLGGRL